MSISRKNWSALSSLARQWTMEDEEEAERERRRRGKSITTAEPDVDSSPDPKNQSSASDSVSGTESPRGSQDISSLQQIQLDFVEMLRVRDEKRRLRHVEILRQQKEGEDDPEGSGRRGDEGGVSLALLGGLDEEDSVFNPQPPFRTSTSTKANITAGSRQHENGKASHRPPDPDVIPASNSSRKFVSSVSISLDNSSPASGQTTPTHPSSPMGRSSPQEHWSPSTRESRSPVQNGHTVETSLHDSSSKGDSEQTAKPPFVRQSSRTLSFRMMKKKEEEKSPLQRSSSVRIVSKKFESSKEPNDNEDKSSFQRNSRQRISSRSIKEKMERLAQAAQKSEAPRSPDVTQRTLFLLEEVSRKRTLFEKDEPAQSLTSPGASRKDFKSFTSGMSERINRFVKSNQPGSSLSPDLRHVDISSKRSLFENRGEDAAPKTSPAKTYK